MPDSQEQRQEDANIIKKIKKNHCNGAVIFYCLKIVFLESLERIKQYVAEMSPLKVFKTMSSTSVFRYIGKANCKNSINKLNESDSNMVFKNGCLFVSVNTKKPTGKNIERLIKMFNFPRPYHIK